MHASLAASADTPLRFALRDATQDIHQRLHLHSGFASVQDGTIALIPYRNLIARLYGFYVPFEAATGSTPERSTWLAQDLATIDAGMALHVLPVCADIPRFDTAARRLGAAYMAEGSALGGRALFRGLDHLFGHSRLDGRRFFNGFGAGTGVRWAATLAQLAAAGQGLTARSEIIVAAGQAFAAFENWLEGWSIIADV